MSKVYQNLEEFQEDYQYNLSDEESLLGEGTYGAVYEAYDDTLHRKVAIKIGKNLMAEFLAAKDLKHRNIAKYEACYRISDKNIGIKDYAIMQLYPEGNLSKLLKTHILTEEQCKSLVKGILEGLKYLHEHKRIHRDLKPANILIFRKIDKGGNIIEFVPLISDFGLTKVVEEGDYVDGSDVELSDGRGTASYKAPEQIEGEQAHFNLDLWAFGVILYEIMLGEKPFKAGQTGNDSQKLNKLLHLIKEAVIPEKIVEISEPYRAIIKRCLVKDIHERARKADELIDILEEIPQKLAIAKALLKKGELAEANRKTEQLLKLRPLFKEAQKLKAECALLIEQEKEVARKLTEARSFLESGELESAKKSFEAVLTLDSANAEAKLGLERCEALLKRAKEVEDLLKAGNKLLKTENYSDAKYQFEKVIALESDNATALAAIKICEEAEAYAEIAEESPTDEVEEVIVEEPTDDAAPLVAEGVQTAHSATQTSDRSAVFQNYRNSILIVVSLITAISIGYYLYSKNRKDEEKATNEANLKRLEAIRLEKERNSKRADSLFLLGKKQLDYLSKEQVNKNYFTLAVRLDSNLKPLIRKALLTKADSIRKYEFDNDHRTSDNYIKLANSYQ